MYYGPRRKGWQGGRGSGQGQKICKKNILKCSRQLIMGVGLPHCRWIWRLVADKMEEADKMFEEVVQVEKIACFLGSWWGGSANLSNFIKGKCHMGKWHIIALFEQINTDHKKQQSKVLVAALSMLDVSYFVVDCERSIWAVDRHQAIWKKSLLSGIHINRV